VTGSFREAGWAGGAFKLLKMGGIGLKTVKQVETRLANLRKILSICRFWGMIDIATLLLVARKIACKLG
jgi:hypothetical protein